MKKDWFRILIILAVAALTVTLSACMDSGDGEPIGSDVTLGDSTKVPSESEASDVTGDVDSTTSSDPSETKIQEETTNVSTDTATSNDTTGEVTDVVSPVETEPQLQIPWENGGKLPSEYTWVEFNDLMYELQVVFSEWFETPEAFNKWKTIAQYEISFGELPWLHGGKNPNEYTWEEFNALNDGHKEMFFEWFENSNDFDSWVNNAKLEASNREIPWLTGGKTPDRYTWKEYEALSDAHQEKFFEWFKNIEAFEEWRILAQFEDTYGEIPWLHGGKNPDQYTWAEFEKLSEAHQEMFFEWFISADVFDNWMITSQFENTYGEIPWLHGGKTPDKYTWVEFEQLSEAHQEMFYEWFSPSEAFDKWLAVAQFENTYGDIPWLHGGKTPDKYTWVEFEQLSEAHQEMFYEWFSPSEAFDKWLAVAQFENTYGDIPWLHGGKTPDKYTWAEFEKLSDAHQEMFFEWFATVEAFDAWITAAQKQ